MKKILSIGTRGSQLALAQAKQVQKLIHLRNPKLRTPLVILKTTGDEFQSVELFKKNNIGVFTKKLEEKLLPEVMRTDYGDITIKAIFRSERDSHIVGGLVTKGKVVKDSTVIIYRADVEEGEGILTELQSNKRPVQEVPMGSECGLSIKTKVHLKEGDVLHFYKEESQKRKLEFTTDVVR